MNTTISGLRWTAGETESDTDPESYNYNCKRSYEISHKQAKWLLEKLRACKALPVAPKKKVKKNHSTTLVIPLHTHD